ncbi:MAG: T9SS type A sorting domain-containing protein [Crocinitomix sp.]|nr:T9SS type A sorting domain-containing protein [Crocinitomix sp.]
MVVFDNVEITIEPGVELRFNAATNLELRGKLTAIGTATDSIVFTSNVDEPARHDWLGIKVIGNADPTYEGGQVTMEYVRGEYAKTFINMDLAYNGPYLYNNCTFFDNSKVNEDGGAPLTKFEECVFRENGQGLDWCQFDSEAIGCHFLDNGQGLAGIDLIKNCYFSGNIVALSPYGATINCLIKNNDVGVKCSFNAVNNTFTGNTVFGNVVGVEIQSYFNESVTFTDNVICNNSFYDIKFLDHNNADLSDNCWCTERSDDIAGNIYDGYDNIAYGLVTFEPFNTDCGLASIPSEEISVSYSIYPNPFTNQFTFESNQENEVMLTFTDISGKIIFRTIFTKTINITDVYLDAGIYLYQLRDEYGSVTTGKLVKE